MAAAQVARITQPSPNYPLPKSHLSVRNLNNSRNSNMTSPHNLEGITPLMVACQQGRVTDVRTLIRKKPDSVRDRTRSEKVALHFCAEGGSVDCLEAMLEADNGLINAQDEEGYTPIHLAVINGNKDVVKGFIATKADLNCLDNEKHSLVHWATVCGELDILDILLTSGAPATTPDIHLAHPIHYAAQLCGNVNGISETRNRVQSTLYGVSPKKGLLILHRLIQHGVPMDARDQDGRQPLLWAASAGSADAILSLLNAGARVEAEDKDGLTALHCAASRGHTDCLETLIALCGAEVDVIDKNGCSALFYAVTLGHADCTELLLNFGAEPNRQDRKGRTPAHCGASKGQLETIKLLAKHEGNLWMRNVRGDLPLHEAVLSRRKDLVTWLLVQRPDSVNAANNDGRCPIHLAALNNNVEMVKILIDNHADVNPLMRTGKGVTMTPLDAAIHKGNSAVAKFLQLHGGLPANSLNDTSLQRRLNRTLESQARSTSSLHGSQLGHHEQSPDNDTRGAFTSPEILDISVVRHYAHSVSGTIVKESSTSRMVTSTPIMQGTSMQTDSRPYLRDMQVQVSEDFPQTDGTPPPPPPPKNNLSAHSKKSEKKLRRKRSSREKGPDSHGHARSDSTESDSGKPARSSRPPRSRKASDASVVIPKTTGAESKSSVTLTPEDSEREIVERQMAICTAAEESSDNARNESEKFSELENVVAPSSESEVREEELHVIPEHVTPRSATPVGGAGVGSTTASRQSSAARAQNGVRGPSSRKTSGHSRAGSRAEVDAGTPDLSLERNTSVTEGKSSGHSRAGSRAAADTGTPDLSPEPNTSVTEGKSGGQKSKTPSAHRDKSVSAKSRGNSAEGRNQEDDSEVNPKTRTPSGGRGKSGSCEAGTSRNSSGKNTEQGEIRKSSGRSSGQARSRNSSGKVTGRTPSRTASGKSVELAQSRNSSAKITDPAQAQSRHSSAKSARPTQSRNSSAKSTPHDQSQSRNSSGGKEQIQPPENALEEEIIQETEYLEVRSEYQEVREEHVTSTENTSTPSADSHQQSTESPTENTVEKLDEYTEPVNIRTEFSAQSSTEGSHSNKSFDAYDVIDGDQAEVISLQEAAARRRKSKSLSKSPLPKRSVKKPPPPPNPNYLRRPKSKSKSPAKKIAATPARQLKSPSPSLNSTSKTPATTSGVPSSKKPAVVRKAPKKVKESEEDEIRLQEELIALRKRGNIEASKYASKIPTTTTTTLTSSKGRTGGYKMKTSAPTPAQEEYITNNVLLPEVSNPMTHLQNESLRKRNSSEGNRSGFSDEVGKPNRDSGYSDQVIPTTSASEDQRSKLKGQAKSTGSIRRRVLAKRPKSNTSLGLKKSGALSSASKGHVQRRTSEENQDESEETSSHAGSIGSEEDSRSRRSKRRIQRPRSRLTFSKGEDLSGRQSPQTKKSVDVATPVSVTQAMQASMRKYHLERKIFQELLELKRLQIRAGKANEQILVKRLSDTYKKNGLSINFRDYEGPYTFRNFEKYLYDQLRLLQANRRILPRFAPSDDLEKLSTALKKMNATKLPFLEDAERCEEYGELCTQSTHRCHHAAHAYTGIPCAAYIGGRGSRTGFLPRVDPLKAPGPTQTDPLTRNAALHAHPGMKMIVSPRGDTDSPITLEVQQGTKTQVFALPSQSLDPGKNYYVSLSIRPTPSPTVPPESPVKMSSNSNVDLDDNSGQLSAPPPPTGHDPDINVEFSEEAQNQSF